MAVGEGVFSQGATAVCLSRGCESGRYFGQCNISSGFHLSESFDPDQRYPGSTSGRSSAFTFPRFKLYLSEARAAAHKGGVSSDRPAGRDKSQLRGCQDLWYRNVLVL